MRNLRDRAAVRARPLTCGGAWAAVGLSSVMNLLACGDTLLDSLGESRIRPTLIDDLEDGDENIPTAYGRRGEWYYFNDCTGEQGPKPIAPVRVDDSPVYGHFSAYTKGGGFTDWGAGLGIAMAGEQLCLRSDPRAVPGVVAAGDDGCPPYDASAYRGIGFWAKRSAGVEVQFVRVNFPSTRTSSNKTCEPVADASSNAPNPSENDHFGKLIELTPEWRRHELLFDELTQVTAPPGGHKFPRKTFRDIQFLIPRNRSFELWVDQVEFIP